MRVFHDRPYVIAESILNTMGYMQHTFGVRELIRAGLQDLDKARELLQELQANGVSDDRLHSLMAMLEHSCDPDVALRKLIDIITALQSQGSRLDDIVTSG